MVEDCDFVGEHDALGGVVKDVDEEVGNVVESLEESRIGALAGGAAEECLEMALHICHAAAAAGNDVVKIAVFVEGFFCQLACAFDVSVEIKFLAAASKLEGIIALQT